jgi:hypothetical protein
MAAAFNGQNIFGVAVTTSGPSINPRRAQDNQYPALNGTESLDMGDSGAFTTVSGRLHGATQGDLSAARLLLLSYYDGAEYVLTLPEDSWPNVKLVSVEWGPKGDASPDLGYSRTYTARFQHLTI